MSHHSPGYSLSIRLRYPDAPRFLGKLISRIGEVDGLIGAIDMVDSRDGKITRDITVSASTVEHGQVIAESLGEMDDVEVIHVSDRVFLMHLGGKLEITPRSPIKTRDDLSMAYTPGVARICEAIHQDPEAAFTLTIKRNMVAVISDGSAILGLGNLAPRPPCRSWKAKRFCSKSSLASMRFPFV